MQNSPRRDLANIDRRSFLGVAGTSLALQGTADTPGRPNILHIMSDQQQWATLAGRSPCRTPNLNRLASQGLLFERSYTPSAVCCPARAMLLSGAYHWHNGVYNQIHSSPSVHRDMFPDVVLYSQLLNSAGYRLGYVGKWHASWNRSPLDFGFHEIAGVNGCDPKILAGANLNPDNVETPKERPRLISERKMSWPGSKPFTMWGVQDGAEEATPEYRTAEQAIRMMRRFAKGSSPWHVETHFVAPHDAYVPLKKYRDRYRAEEIPVPETFHDTFEGKPGLHRRESQIWGAVTEDDYRQSRAHYYAYTEQLDAQSSRRNRPGRKHHRRVHNRPWRHGWLPQNVDQGLDPV
jgi:arylsulfatase A-like enzyme